MIIVRALQGQNDVDWNVTVPSGGHCRSRLNRVAVGDGLVEEGEVTYLDRGLSLRGSLIWRNREAQESKDRLSLEEM